MDQLDIKNKQSIDILNIINDKDLYVTFPGGVGDFGKNCSIVFSKKKIIWIDIGISFANSETPGAKYITISTNWIEELPPTAIILTHAHEDHIGAIIFFYSYISPNTPIYLSQYTYQAIQDKFQENNLSLKKFKFHIIKTNCSHSLEHLTFSFFFVPHSIIQSFALGIHDKQYKKKLFYTGDFKLQSQSIKLYQPELLKKYAPVDVLFCDATGALNNAQTPSEESLLENFENIFKTSKRNIFVTLFASNIERIRNIYTIAQKHHYNIYVFGLSIKKHIQFAFECQEFPVPFAKMQVEHSKQGKSLYFISGCQGIQRSSLDRLSRDQLKKIQIHPLDTLIYSARTIPGNEEAIYRCLNRIAQRKVHIIGLSPEDPPVHVSGHGNYQDMKEMIQMLKPINFSPIHGQHIQFNRFQEVLRNDSTLSNLKVEHLQPNNIYAIQKNLKLVHEITFQNTYIEPQEMHYDSILYLIRKKFSTEGVCNVIISQENSFCKVQYIGVATSHWLRTKSKQMKTLVEKKVSPLFWTQEHENIQKAIREINKIHQSFLNKEPYINIMFI